MNLKNFKLDIPSLVKKTKNVVTSRSPELLVGTAVAGIITTGILAAKAGYKARGIIDEAEAERGEPLTTQDKFTLTWLTYATPALTGATSIAAVVGAHAIHTKRYAALSGVYAIAANKADDLQAEVEKHLGPKKRQEMQDELAQRAVDREGPFENHEVILTGEKKELCFDEYGARYFDGDMNKIDRAFLELNHALAIDGSASLNDFYDHLGLPPNVVGAELGWSGRAHVEPIYGSVKTNTGTTALSFSFRNNPEFGFENHR